MAVGGSNDAPDDRFVEEWKPFVLSIANKVRAQLDLRMDMDELMAFGFSGLIEARSRYDAARGVQFNTFAYYRVRGAIMDGIRSMAWLPRHAQRLRNAVEASDRVLEETGAARAAAPPGAAGSKEIAADHLADALGRLAATYVMASVGQPEQELQSSPEDEAIDAESAERVRACLRVLPERERALVEGFYFEGRRFDEVAAALGISKSWASRLHTKALSLLRDALEAG